MGSDQGLVDACVLDFELLQIVDVDNAVAKLVEVATNIFELLLVEGQSLQRSQLRLFVFHRLNV